VSKQVDTLLPYQFEMDVKDERSSRVYASANTWTPSREDNSVILPSHFQNDGTLLYMLSPVRLPPTSQEIYHWLSNNSNKPESVHYEEACISSQDECTEADASQSSQMLRPSSPKYNEAVISSCFTNNITCEDDCGQSSDLASRPEPNCSNDQRQSKFKNVTEGTRKKVSSEVLNQQIGSREDISQISGGTAQTDFTPTGFKDPSSNGCGQQISIMSIEVKLLFDSL
jgi:DNA polymerase zeta